VWGGSIRGDPLTKKPAPTQHAPLLKKWLVPKERQPLVCAVNEPSGCFNQAGWEFSELFDMKM